MLLKLYQYIIKDHVMSRLSFRQYKMDVLYKIRWDDWMLVKFTWKCGLDTHLASCLNRGHMTLVNSAGSITSSISSSSLRNITSLGLWTFGQNLSRPIITWKDRHDSLFCDENLVGIGWENKFQNFKYGKKFEMT